MAEERPVTEGDWETVAQMATRAEGKAAISALSAADVPCKLVVDHTDAPAPEGIDPNIGQATSGVQVRVPRERRDEALALLSADQSRDVE